jgi:hypothetical protein
MHDRHCGLGYGKILCQKGIDSLIRRLHCGDPVDFFQFFLIPSDGLLSQNDPHIIVPVLIALSVNSTLSRCSWQYSNLAF